MKTKLSSIAKVYSGYSVRTKNEQNSLPNINMVLPSNVFQQNFNKLNKVSVKLAKNTNILKNQDVLLSNRVHFKAALFKDTPKENALAAASLWVIRLKENAPILPEFLTFWLNSEHGQKALQQRINAFDTLKTIKKEAVEDLMLPTPPLERQKKISELYFCFMKQKELLNKKMELNLQLLNALTEQI